MAWRLSVLGSAEQCSIVIGLSPHSSVWHKSLPLHRNTPYCSTDARRGPVQHRDFKHLHKSSSETELGLPLLFVALFFLLISLSRGAVTGAPYHMGRCLKLNISDLCAQNWTHRVISATCPLVSYPSSGTSCIPAIFALASSSHKPDLG